MDSPTPPAVGGDPKEKRLPTPGTATAKTSSNSAGEPGAKATQTAKEAKDQIVGKASAAADQAKHAASDAVDSAKHAASDALDQGKRKASELKDQAVEQAKQTGSQLQSQVTQLVGDQKAKAADQIDGFAGAIRKAAQSLHEENDEALAGYADGAANAVEQARDYLRDRKPADLFHDLGGFIRRRPEWGLGGLFIAGLAAGRFLKASHNSSAPTSSSTSSSTGGSTYAGRGVGTRTSRYAYTPEEDLAVNAAGATRTYNREMPGTPVGLTEPEPNRTDFPPATGGGSPTGRGMTDYNAGTVAGHASAVSMVAGQELKGEVH